MNHRITSCLFLFLLLPLHGQVAGQTDWDAVEIQVTPLRGGVHMVVAAGGNQAVFVGPDGTLVVDAQYSEISDRLLARIREMEAEGSHEPSLRYLVNTHWHFDHTGGNSDFARAGAVIMAQEGVRRLLSEDRVLTALGDREVPAAPEDAWPTITFNNRLNLDWNGDLVHLVHMPLAHSDGDVIVHFRDADVVHMGDLFFNGMYPYIDVDYGGNISGMARAIEEVLSHTKKTTLFIPGHGPLADREDLEAYGAMLVTVRDRIRALVEEGKTREVVVAARPTSDLDPDWVRGEGPGESDFFVGLVYDGMVKGKAGG